MNFSPVLMIILILAAIIMVLYLLLSHQKKKTKIAEIDLENERNRARESINGIIEKCEVRIHELSEQHIAALESTRKECESQIREVKETIEVRKEKLSQMSEKELLISVMVSLGGFGDRFERLERKLDIKANELFAGISNMNRSFSEQMEELGSSISAVKDCIGEENDNHYSVYSALEGIRTELSLIKELIGEEDDYEDDSINDKLQELQSDLSSIKKSVCGYYNESLLDEIDEIKTKISSFSKEDSDDYIY